MFEIDESYIFTSKRKKCSLKRTTFKKYNTLIIVENFYNSLKFKITPQNDTEIDEINNALEYYDYLVLSKFENYRLLSTASQFDTNWYSLDYDIENLYQKMKSNNLDEAAFFNIHGFKIDATEIIVSDGIQIELESLVTV